MSKQDQTTRGGDLSLPPKRVDTTKPLNERLTDNAYDNILPARYLNKDADGNVVEEQEELFPRVAKNIALAEAVYTDETVLIDHTHIKPEHPNREKLVEEVFFRPTQPSRNNPNPSTISDTTQLTEENVKYVSYDALIDDLPEDTKEVVKRWKQEFQDGMESLSIMPNSPTLMNAGNELQQLSACFVQSPDDDMESIHETAKDAALIFQSGGGMGYAFWKLRPYGDVVGSTGGIASGPLTFMETYDQMCGTVAQGGSRRGAQMAVMRVSHPDVIEFIHAKNKDVSLAHTLSLNDPDDYTYTTFNEALDEARELIDEEGRVPKHLRNAVEGHLSNFNISVGVTDDFMDALYNDEEFTFTNPRTDEPHIATEETKELWSRYGLGEHVEPGEELSVPADVVWERMINGAHENGEPGVIYLERTNKKHSFDVEKHPEHRILATNPCGEQPLEEQESCNLGHINLSTIADEHRPDWREFKKRPNIGSFSEFVSSFLDMSIDWQEFNHRIRVNTRLLENVVTMSDFPIDDIEEKVRENRKIGLGVMGLAQLYIQLGVEYGSEAGNEIARQLMSHINHESKWQSHKLAEDRGSFGEWEKSKYANPMEYQEWFEHHTNERAEDWEDGFPIRNHNTTTIAPTGTTSMVGNTTGGCEPIYNVAYYKNVSDDVQGDEMLVEFDDYFLRVLEENGISVEAVKQEAQEQMSDNEFDGIDSLDTVPDKISELFVVTSDLTGKEHAAVQCACQEGVDSSISKTCNFSNDATVDDIDDVYRYIYDNGGKGVTVYRDGTRSKQVLTTRSDNKEASVGELSDSVVGEYLAEEHDIHLDELEGSQTEQASRESDGEECPDCGGELSFEEGCKKCSNSDCAFSACEV